MAKAKTKRSTKRRPTRPVDPVEVRDWIDVLHQLDIVVGMDTDKNFDEHLYLVRDMQNGPQTTAIEAFREFRKRDPEKVDKLLKEQVAKERSFVRCYLNGHWSPVWALQPPVKR